MPNTVKKVRKSAAPFYGAAAAWVVYALAFDLYRWNHFVFAALLSAGVFLLLRGVCRDEVTEIPVPDPPREEEKPTGNAELDKMISDGRKANTLRTRRSPPTSAAWRPYASRSSSR